MSLVADYDSSSETSEDEVSDQEIQQQTNVSTAPKPKLPTPDFIGKSNQCELGTSVFKNPFVEEQNAKEALLQKHVKMVESKERVVTINGKKICWNYRKGRCRFGQNCKFAHDSDLQVSKEQQNTTTYQKEELSQEKLEELNKKTLEIISNKLKRKRPGLTQGLVPGKKVMKMYQKQKN